MLRSRSVASVGMTIGAAKNTVFQNPDRKKTEKLNNAHASQHARTSVISFGSGWSGERAVLATFSRSRNLVFTASIAIAGPIKDPTALHIKNKIKVFNFLMAILIF